MFPNALYKNACIYYINSVYYVNKNRCGYVLYNCKLCEMVIISYLLFYNKYLETSPNAFLSAIPAVALAGLAVSITKNNNTKTLWELTKY